MFCSTCSAFIDGWSRELDTYEEDHDGAIRWSHFARVTHVNLNSLKASSEKGCIICRNSWFTLNKYEQAEFHEDTAFELEVKPDGGRPILKANFRKADGSLLSRTLAMFFKQDIDSSISAVVNDCAEMDQSSTGSSASVKLAKFWLERCLQQHSKCPQPDGFLPTRLIDVITTKAGGDVRLVESSTISQTAGDLQYAALSHCWGKDKFLITQSATAEQHMKCIPFEALPKSFQDAIDTVRSVGLRYLWIDSLCIIQDSSEDWLKESVQMCNIYAQALFTITSAHASGAHGGMFRQRDGIRTMLFEVKLAGKSRAVRLMYVPTGQREVSWDLNDLPIYSRAWCFQEMMLSTRNLIFDPTGIRWECVTCAGTEGNLEANAGRHTMAVRDMMTSMKQATTSTDFFESLSPGSLTMQALVWQSIVKDYAARDLTKYADKLIAIDGVAQVAAKRSDNTYLAGLWRKHLFLNLAWYVQKSDPTDGHYLPGSLPYREQDSVAPSWSWASVNRRIDYDSFAQQEAFCEVVDGYVKGTPHKLSGKLVLHGDTRELYVLSPHNARYANLDKLAEQYQYLDHYNSKSRLFSPNMIMLATLEAPSMLSRSHILPAEWYPEDTWDEDKPVTFIAFMRRPRVEGMPLDLRRQYIHTLALVPTSTGTDEYRRIGLAVWHDCSWFGHQCAEDFNAKKASWQKLGRSWSRVKPAELREGDQHKHPVNHDPLPREDVYDTAVNMVRRTITVV